MDLTLLASFMGRELGRIAIAVAIIAVFAIAGKVFYKFFKLYARKAAEKTKSQIDNVLIDIIETPVVMLLFIAGVYFAFVSLEIKNPYYADLFTKAIGLIATLIGAWLASRIVGVLIEAVIVPISKRTKSTIDDQLIPLFSKGAKVVVWIFALLLILSNFGYDITALIAGLGIGGIALAFAAQETIANVFGGVSIIIDKTFKVGDQIKLESGEVGKVHDITIRTTRIKSYDNELIIVPNALMAKSKITNFAQPDTKIRESIIFSTEYSADPERVRKIVTEAMKKVEVIMKEPAPCVDFKEMGEYGLKFKAFFWFENYDIAWAKKWEVNRAIFYALKEAKIGIPFPTHTIYLNEKTNKKK